MTSQRLPVWLFGETTPKDQYWHLFISAKISSIDINFKLKLLLCIDNEVVAGVKGLPLITIG